MSQTDCVCVVPWLHRLTNEQGLHQVCASGMGAANTLHGTDGKDLHISQQLTDSQVLNSPDLKAIRLAMMRGEWPAACERCRRSEEAGATSIRHLLNSSFGHRIEDELRQTARDGTLYHPQVRYADIRLGNACNLTCRMCGPGYSRLWAEHYNQVQPGGYLIPESELAAMGTNNWVKHQPAQWLIEQCLPTVERLHFAGGEPLIIPEMLEALDFCIASGRANQIDLTYSTNITVLPERAAQLWPHFRSVSLICSVDGFGPLNDYIRRPSKWADVDRNLHLLDRHFEEWKLRSVVCSAAVMAYNILQLGEIFDYLATGFRRVHPLPQLVPLYDPRYLSIQILPPQVKEVARERLLAERAKASARQNPSLHFLLSSIDTVLAHLDEPSTPKDMTDFLYFSEKSDCEFGDSWRQACPDLARLLRPSDRAAGWGRS